MSRPSHTDVVDAWLACAGSAPTSDELVRRLDGALAALWARAEVTLGRPTVAAVMDRAMIHARAGCPALAALTIEPRRGVSCDALGRATDLEAGLLARGIRRLLIDLLTLVGVLTAEILAPALHAALLSAVARPAGPAVRAAGEVAPPPDARSSSQVWARGLEVEPEG